MALSKRISWIAIVLVALAMSCSGCGINLRLGVRPYSVGMVADCRGLDGCSWGLEAGGWRAGVSAFPDVGPLEAEDAGETDP
jgi:hypothetical protein